MALRTKPKVKLVSVGKAKIANAVNKKATAMKPGTKPARGAGLAGTSGAGNSKKRSKNKD